MLALDLLYFSSLPTCRLHRDPALSALLFLYTAGWLLKTPLRCPKCEFDAVATLRYRKDGADICGLVVSVRILVTPEYLIQPVVLVMDPHGRGAERADKLKNSPRVGNAVVCPRRATACWTVGWPRPSTKETEQRKKAAYVVGSHSFSVRVKYQHSTAQHVATMSFRTESSVTTKIFQMWRSTTLACYVC